MGFLSDVFENFGNALTGGKQAQKDVQEGYNKGIDAQTQMFDKAQATLKPYVDFGQQYGTQGLAELQANPNSLADSEGYKFTRDQGLQAITRKNAAAGFRGSGNELYDMVRYASGLASTTYGEEWNRRYNLAALGQNAGSMASTQSMQTGENLATLYASSGRDVGGMAYQSGRDERNYMHQVGMSFLGGGGGGMGMCWVAEELYGKTSDKTLSIRAYANAHEHDEDSTGEFLRKYKDKGMMWAAAIKEGYLRELAEKVWDRLYDKALAEGY